LLLIETEPLAPPDQAQIVMPPYYDEPVRGPSLFERMAASVARRKLDQPAALIAAE